MASVNIHIQPCDYRPSTDICGQFGVCVKSYKVLFTVLLSCSASPCNNFPVYETVRWYTEYPFLDLSLRPVSNCSFTTNYALCSRLEIFPFPSRLLSWFTDEGNSRLYCWGQHLYNLRVLLTTAAVGSPSPYDWYERANPMYLILLCEISYELAGCVQRPWQRPIVDSSGSTIAGWGQTKP